MKLIFFDEAKDDPDYPHYHVGGVCIDEKDLVEIEKAIAAVAEKAFGTAELTRDIELHAAEIYHRKRNFKDEVNFGKPSSRDEVQLIDVQINCKRLRGAQTADELTFMFLCERANDLVRKQKCLGMLIGDRENDRLADRFAVTLSGYRARGTDFAFGRDIRHLADCVHFTHSHLSRFLQLADVYVWLLQFRNRNRDSQNERHRARVRSTQERPCGPVSGKIQGVAEVISDSRTEHEEKQAHRRPG